MVQINKLYFRYFFVIEFNDKIPMSHARDLKGLFCTMLLESEQKFNRNGMRRDASVKLNSTR